jgi:hypothetical protein
LDLVEVFGAGPVLLEIQFEWVAPVDIEVLIFT